MTSLLTVTDLHVRHGRVVAVAGVDLSVDAGEVVAVLGRNGAGKSTLVRAVAGLVRPAAGTVSLLGRDITRMPADRRSRMGMVLVPEGRRIFTNVTVAENLRLGGFSRSVEERASAMERVYGLFPILAERSDAPASHLSGGQQQILAMARALMGDPKVLLLDEPSLGLAPKVVDEVYEQLRRLRDAGTGMVLVEQHVDRALDLADNGIILNLGEVALTGEPEWLRQDRRLVEAYLGRAD